MHTLRYFWETGLSEKGINLFTAQLSTGHRCTGGVNVCPCVGADGTNNSSTVTRVVKKVQRVPLTLVSGDVMIYLEQC